MGSDQWSRRRLLGAAGTSLAAGLAGCSLDAPTSSDATDDGPARYETYTAPERGSDGDTPTAQSAYSSVYKQVADSVAAVRVETTNGTASGTAWLYDEDFLVTNEHVVGGSEAVSVWFEGVGWQEATTLATDVYSDLAVVEAPNRPDDIEPIPLVASEPPVGTEVVAIGNPFGLSGSLSAGIISGQDRTLPAANGFSIPDAVQTDAAVNPGNSGGPLVNLDGELVGVVNAGGGDNIGFAISAAMVDRVVPSLVRDGSYDHSYMGVNIAPVTPPVIEANDLDVSWGVYIDNVVDGSPSAGVLEGSTGSETIVVDNRRIGTGGDVVYRMDGVDIPTQQALSTFLALETRPGDTIDVEVIRDGRREIVELTLGSRPAPR
ncbi:S1C family serine protease [Salinibaculum rarum]|uniref:S1C family serine protease n=1 Tax=Salinibaculum rarum TaxID=3058903 RepID=UPI00265F8164|nr:trypsin-like peptidase domain-containing protein [Salinibaculum sp. KK48]